MIRYPTGGESLNPTHLGARGRAATFTYYENGCRLFSHKKQTTCVRNSRPCPARLVWLPGGWRWNASSARRRSFFSSDKKYHPWMQTIHRTCTGSVRLRLCLRHHRRVVRFRQPWPATVSSENEVDESLWTHHVVVQHRPKAAARAHNN